jgi:hypothetical protein
LAPYFLPDGDALRMQFLGVDLDTSLLQIESLLARELLTYMEEDRRRVGALADAHFA